MASTAGPSRNAVRSLNPRLPRLAAAVARPWPEPGVPGTRGLRKRMASTLKASGVRGKWPLSGHRVLVGRTRAQASALSSGLKALGAEVVEIPFIEVRRPRSYRALDAALKNLIRYDWLIFTSVNGVQAVAERMKKSGLTRKNLRHLRVAAIGPATQQAIERLGIEVHLVPEHYVAESVVESLRRQVEGKRVLLARAKVARDVIPRELRRLGARVEVVEAYQTGIPLASRARLRALLEDSKRCPDLITFTSSSTVKNFLALLGRAPRRPRNPLAGIRLASIGPVTSSTLRESGLPVDIEASDYTIPGLIAAIVAATHG
jgi:uroporphyrinogen-III synthase